MLAAAINDSYAEAEGDDTRLKKGEPDAYVPVEPSQKTALVFPGPAMQLRSTIVASDRLYRLRGLFVVEFEIGEDGEDVFASHRTLPVHGHGATQAEALSSFLASFDFQWRNLVDADPTMLTPGGRRRRESMQAVVEAIEDLKR